MLYLGLIISFVSALIFVGGRVRHIREESEAYSAVCAMLLHIRGKLSSGGGSLPSILADFRSNAPRVREAVDLLRGSGGFFRDRILETEFLAETEDSEKLRSYFLGFGRSYIGEEMKKLDAVIAYFEKRALSVSETSAKDIKVTLTLFAFFFVSAFILIL